MNNIKKILGLGITSFLLVPTVSKAATVPASITTDYVISENIILENDVVIEEEKSLNIDKTIGTDIVIDLNGHTITKKGTWDYAISNENKNGITVTIKNGNVTCESTKSSCIRNYGKMKIEDLNVESKFTAVKNEEETELNIVNSNIKSTANNSGTIMNYGNSLIENSVISQPSSVAIFGLTYNEYSSSIVVKNSKINAKQAVQTYYDDLGNAQKPVNARANVVINGGSINEGAIINLREIDGKLNGKLTVEGNVKAPLSVLPYMAQGSTITLYENEEVDSITVPTGVTVKIAGNKQIIENEDGTISALQNADYTKVNAAIEQASKIDPKKYTEESVKALENAVKSVKTGLTIDMQAEVDQMALDIEEAIKKLKEISTVEEPKKDEVKEEVKDNEPEKNVKTGDGIILYGTLAVLSIAGLGLATKKILL